MRALKLNDDNILTGAGNLGSVVALHVQAPQVEFKCFNAKWTISAVLRSRLAP